MIEEPIFTPYLILDEDGFWAGIKDDAPDDAKKAYEEYLKQLSKGDKI